MYVSKEKYEEVSIRDSRSCGKSSSWGRESERVSREYGISRYAIQSWLEEPAVPKQRGRKPARTLAEYRYENKRLKMENELLRDFLQSTERK